MQNQTDPKDDAFEAFLRSLSDLPQHLRAEEFRRAVLSRARGMQLRIGYGLNIFAEYPAAGKLLSRHANAKHDIKLFGGAAFVRFPDAGAIFDRALRLLESETRDVYDAFAHGAWSQAAVVAFETDGRLEFETRYPGVSGELLVLHVKEGVRAHLSERIVGEGNVASARTIVAIVEDGAELYARTEVDEKSSGTFVLRQYAEAGKDGRVSWYEVVRPRGSLQTRTLVVLQGEEAQSGTYSAALAGEEAQVDILHETRHMAPRTKSRIADVGVATGASRIVYRGGVALAKDAHGAEGKQQARFTVLSKGAKVDAIPALDIGVHDVRCSHALSVGHLSPITLFYPKLRGIPADAAAGFVVSGMMKDTLARGGAGEREAYEMSRIAEAIVPPHAP